MVKQLLQKKERKVEYVELIYDLIFVYIIGRNNSLLHHLSGGFVGFSTFMTYILVTLAVIQIWNFSTYYINIYGRHSLREHVFLFTNMFLLYFIGEGTRADWQGYHTMYHIAWALILVNIGAQYLVELRGQETEHHRKRIVRMAVILFAEALVVAAAVAEFRLFGHTWLSIAAILLGMVAVMTLGHEDRAEYVDFSHLSERAMLYVVFTFGEMVIAVSSYFEEEITPNNLYFAAMVFLIVVGLFLSYGVFYDHIVDREKRTDGLLYMLLHIFIIFALNNITASLEFMSEVEVELLPKLLFLIASFVLFYVFLLGTGVFAKSKCLLNKRFLAEVGAVLAAFIALMFIFRENMRVNIAVTVCFVFAEFIIIYRYGKTKDVEPKHEAE